MDMRFAKTSVAGRVPGALYAALLAVLVSTISSEAETSPPEPDLALGTAHLKLIIPRDDWQIYETRRRPDNTAVYYALSSVKRDMAFSFFLDDATSCRTAPACRELALANPAFRDARNVVLAERGRFSVAEFTLDAPVNPPAKQVHLLAEAFVRGVGVDIHLSKTGAATPDAAPLDEFLNAVRFE